MTTVNQLSRTATSSAGGARGRRVESRDSVARSGGAGVSASYRNYRPLHALIQEKPHEGGSSTPERVKCLEFLLEHGADPQLQGAWPLASAVVIAAGVGEGAYVRVLKAHAASAGADNAGMLEALDAIRKK